MASTYLTKTLSGTGSNTIFTYSAWLKRSNITSDIPRIFEAYNTNLYYTSLRFRPDSNNELEFYSEMNTSPCQLRTSRSFRDVNAWYHIVLTVDTTNATADDRMKLWINGVQETSFSIRTNPSLNQSLNTNNSGNTIYLGRKSYDPTDYFNGSMTHVHYIDGTAYDASAFGQTDTASGIWKPKTSPSVTYGTNGFFLKFANSGSLGTDSSGNGNNFTVNGSGTQTLDTPSNVFATLNPLLVGTSAQSPTYSQGNLTISGSPSIWRAGLSTLVPSQGKWYAEFKWVSGTDSMIGIVNETKAQESISTYFGNSSLGTNSVGYYKSGVYYYNGTTPSYGDTWTTGDIIGIALDLDNKNMYASINGVWQNSGDPTSGATGTGAIDISPLGTGIIFIGFATNEGVNNVNFGNGYFGTTAVSSGNADGAGYGIFEYAPPTGYYALCTKNINTYG